MGATLPLASSTFCTAEEVFSKDNQIRLSPLLLQKEFHSSWHPGRAALIPNPA
jgi:hypothetical protein